MKRPLLFIVSLFLVCSSYAAHIIGGEMRYEYLGPASGTSRSYRITMILFRGTLGAQFADTYAVGIYNNDNGQKVGGGGPNNNWLINRTPPGSAFSVPIIFPTCINNPPNLQYTYAIYILNVDLPLNANGYTVAYQTCCRIDGLANVGNSTGSTYSCVIPGTESLGPTDTDSSPQFGLPVNVICRLAPFTLNFNAVDPNPTDSLVYTLCNAFNGGAATDASFDNPAPPPYGSVIYNGGYSGTNPFGTGATINPQTGVISGMAPDIGKYVVCVCINVYRNGVYIGTHRKDLIVEVSDCQLTVANPMPDFVTCDGFNIQFSHTSSGANSIFWDFGDLSTAADTSLLDSPTYTYPDTGVFKVKLIINKGTGCVDSAIRTIGVYPGFFPGFRTVGSCFTNPYQFFDTTRTNYGVVNTWTWNFGDLATLSDTSHIQNPTWTYPSPGPRTVLFIVSNSKGCKDTVQQIVNVLDRPALLLAFKDTLICRGDVLQLNAEGPPTCTYSWTPLVNIVGANTANPFVSPVTTTWYYVSINDNGCRNNDSVRVRVVPDVTLVAMRDTTICQGDAIVLTAQTDGLQFIWTPAGNLDNPNILNPTAITTTTTTYTITAIIGGCSKTDDVVVTPIPYPIANAGPDPTICYNTSVQLNASIVGSSFVWSPTSYLDNPNVLNPVATPPRTTQYILSAYDTQGCPKPGRDTIMVIVNPKVQAFAGRDTTVVIGQPLQFNATGGVNYFWTPSTGLNNPNIFNPIGIYNASIDSVRYKVIVTDAIGCSDSAYILVKVFKTIPYVFVPTAFTPNNDGRNDLIRPIAVGIQKINYFSIYNRWGQLVFTTTVNGKGWDGRIGGKLQNTGVFVWMVSAIDYLGKPLFLKGTVALIN